MSDKRKLKNFLLVPSVQIKLLSYFIGLFLLTSLTLYSTSYLFFSRLNQKALDVGIPEGHVFFKFVANQKADLDQLYLLLTIANFLLLLGTGLLVSHRLAGPIYKLKKYLTEIDKDSPPFKLREKDFFKDIEPAVDSLKGKLK